MGISLSILLIAAGAVLAWAVNAEVSGVDIQLVGVILFIVGIIGLVTSLIFWSSWGGFGAREAAVRTRPSSSVTAARYRPGMSIIAWIVLGLLGGLIAKKIMPGAERIGLILTTVLGVAGALLGGFLATALGFGDPIDEFFDISTWIAAIVGAMLILFIWNAISSRR